MIQEPKMKKLYLLWFLIYSSFLILIFPQRVGASEFQTAPVKIIVPSIGVSLPVATAKIAYNTWEVNPKGASFGESTTLPGNEGNSVIFAHARPHLFGNLPEVKPGEYIHIFTDKDWFVYQVEETLVVNPENVEVIFANGGYELTLYTCTGYQDTQRFVVKAHLVSPPSY